MELKKVKYAHDYFFRESMERGAIARGIVQRFIEPSILKCINFSSMEIVKDDWVDTVLSEHRADILYRARVSGKQEHIYFLFEHKSYSDRSTYRQIHRYMNQLWEELEKQGDSRQKLPVVIPFIVHHGLRPWNICNSMRSSFAIVEGTEGFIPDFKAIVIDLSLITEDHLGDTVALQGFFLALKFSRSPEVFRVLAKIIRLFNAQEKSGNDYLKVILMYIGAVIPRNTMDEFFTIIRSEHHEGVLYMETVADALRKEGWIKGKVEGRVEVAKKMLERGMIVELIHELTGLPLEQIEKLRKKP